MYLYSKINDRQNEKTTYRKREISVNFVSDRRLIFKIYEEFI